MKVLLFMLAFVAISYGSFAQVDLLKVVSKPPKPKATVSNVNALVQALPAQKRQQAAKACASVV